MRWGTAAQSPSGYIPPVTPPRKLIIDTDPGMGLEITTYHLNLADHPHRGLLLEVAKDALERLIRPSLDRELRRELTDRAHEHAVAVFAKNLRSLLLQPPLRGKKVLLATWASW